MDLKTFQDTDITRLETTPAAAIFWGVGLGKTLAGVERDRRLRDYYPGGSTLVIAQPSIQDHWRNHFISLGYDEHSIFAVSRLNRWDFLDAVRLTPYGVFILNWDLLRLPKVNSSRRYFSTDLYHALIGQPGLPMKRRRPWFHVIADEAHRAKNKDAQQTKVLKQINTQFKTALTGTPIANTPPDLWSILNWLYPKDFSSYWRWYMNYSNWDWDYKSIGINDDGTPKLAKFRVYMGPKNVDRLRMRIDPFTVIRGREVRDQLPPRNVQLVVDLDPKQRRAYDTMRKHMVAWLGEQEDNALTATNAISKYQRLQMLAIAHADVDFTKAIKNGEDVWQLKYHMIDPSAKLDALMDLLEDNSGEQFVIFSQFRGTVELLAQRLERAQIPYGRIIGGQSNSERRSALDDFRNAQTRVIAGTIAAGGEGIDGLQRASALVFVDRDPTTTRNDQAIGRLDRFGQQNQVVVYDLIARGTIDAQRHSNLRTKAEWIQAVMG